MSLLDIGTELRHERYFDSHPRVGGDFAADGADLRGFISIRTLAWGVTIYMGNGQMVNAFQFAPPRGG